jgi:2-oxoglutarate/2-oxoacid ferredoxin oxidoreductase subunit beta
MRDVASDHQLWVEHGKPLLFGKDKNRGLRLAPGGSHVEVVTVGENGVTLDDVAVHDQHNRTLAFLLAQLSLPNFPMAFGVLYCDPMPSYDATVTQQNADAAAKSGVGDIDKLLRSGHTWTVE